MSDFLKDLNEEQHKAVTCIDGPIMVIAGAGSGKTRVLTYRIAYLIAQGIDPFHILALTFTNKAAHEMKERIRNILGSNESRNLWMGTFHSVFCRILRNEGHRLGFPREFAVYDMDDSKRVIKRILDEENLSDKEYKVSIVLNRISSAKTNLMTWAEYQQNSELMDEDKQARRPMTGEIFEKYSKRLFLAQAMDFDDLLVNMYKLLRDFPEMLLKYQSMFRYILVDEYQDTNYAQYVILKLLAARFENICVVGDDAQSIYAFRGANIQNILSFQNDYPDTKLFKLEQNYRSTKTIVGAANSIIVNNLAQIPKIIWTQNDEGERIKVMRALSDNEEGVMVARTIFELKMNEQMHNKDFAILYRINAQSRSFEESLRRMDIPYRVYGGISFYQRREIKDSLAYIRLALNHNDDEAFLRIINYPARGIGKTTIEKMIVFAKEKETSLWNLILNGGLAGSGISGATANRIVDFVTMIRSFAALADKKNAFELASHIIQASGIKAEMTQDLTPEGRNRLENLEELLNGIRDFCERAEQNEEEEVPSLASFLQDIALLTNADEDDKENNDKVSLMTVHSAKGLEFPAVFIAGVEENLFPSQLSLNSRADLEEERRLFYVAVTRAQKHLHMTYSTTRFRWGNLTPCEPSRFLDELDKNCVDFPAYKGFNIKPDSNPFQKDNTKKEYKPKEKFVPKGKLVSINKAVQQPGSPSELMEMIQSGMTVEHERFGKGKVLLVEGREGDRKAVVHFDGIGQKQLLLKFAKLKIVE
ncbi:MAG: UvrD-helicase domain-containing protein [Bacteroidota bacterium]